MFESADGWMDVCVYELPLTSFAGLSFILIHGEFNIVTPWRTKSDPPYDNLDH